jgi:hypothetical protein
VTSFSVSFLSGVSGYLEISVISVAQITLLSSEARSPRKWANAVFHRPSTGQAKPYLRALILWRCKKKFTHSNCVPGWYLYPPSREPLAAMHLILEYCSETDDAQFIGVGI